MADLVQVEKEIGEAIAAVLTRHDLMVNRWVLVSEVFEADGNRKVGAFTSDDLRAWDSLGLLGYILERERAGVFKASLDADD